MRRNPIPLSEASHNDSSSGRPAFAPPCQEAVDCHGDRPDNSCRCSGSWGPFDLEVVDTLAVPRALPPGDYVMQWRCADSPSIQLSVYLSIYLCACVAPARRLYSALSPPTPLLYRIVPPGSDSHVMLFKTHTYIGLC